MTKAMRDGYTVYTADTNAPQRILVGSHDRTQGPRLARLFKDTVRPSDRLLLEFNAYGAIDPHTVTRHVVSDIAAHLEGVEVIGNDDVREKRKTAGLFDAVRAAGMDNESAAGDLLENLRRRDTMMAHGPYGMMSGPHGRMTYQLIGLTHIADGMLLPMLRDYAVLVPSRSGPLCPD